MTSSLTSALASALASAMLVAGLTACSTGPTSATGTSDDSTPDANTSSRAGAFPVTVSHAFGETTIEAEPTRVVTLGGSDHDTVLSLGVVPVGAPEISWGGNASKSTPWFDAELEELGAEPPARYSDLDGAPIQEIAALQPDLVLATYSGLTEAEYEKLSRLAPVVAYPDAAWTTSWQDSLELVGAALGRGDEADRVEEETRRALTAAGEEYPQLIGTSFVFAALSTADTSKIDYYTPDDNRTRVLTDIGMVNAPVIEEISKPGTFYGTISAERASSLESDVLITYAETDKDLATFAKDPLLGRIPALAAGRAFASTDKTEALALGTPDPLSVPYAMETFVPDVAAAVDGS